jgi:hypothetical protein
MNPRTKDPKESAALHTFQQRYYDALSRVTADFSLDVLQEFVEAIEQLEQDYRRASVTMDPLAYQPGRNGTGEGGSRT